MSQKFDEGGAKGLLLVNLGVASDGCRIILDSKEDTTDDGEDENEQVGKDNEVVHDADEGKDEEHNNANHDEKDMSMEKECTTELANCIDEGTIDISDISSKLQELLLCSPLESIQLVPQLQELRELYNALEEEGFTDKSRVQKLTVSDIFYKSDLYQQLEFLVFLLAHTFTHLLTDGLTYAFLSKSLNVMQMMKMKKRQLKRVFKEKHLRGAVHLELYNIQLVSLPRTSLSLPP